MRRKRDGVTGWQTRCRLYRWRYAWWVGYPVLWLLVVGVVGTILPAGAGVGSASPKPASGKPLAWARFDDGPEKYQGTPYWWLGKYELQCRIDVEPESQYALDLLWGSKSDTRSGVITVNGKTARLKYGGYDGFRWVRIELPDDLPGEQYTIRMDPSGAQEAFLAAVRLVDVSQSGQAAAEVPTARHAIQVSTTQGQSPKRQRGEYASAHPDILRVWRTSLADGGAVPSLQPTDSSSAVFEWSDGSQIEEPPSIELAETSAEIAGYSLSKVHQWLHEKALGHIDDETGLYRVRGKWDYSDTAADCYPFLTWAAWATDRDVLDGPVRRILEVEEELCTTKDGLPAPYNFDQDQIQSVNAKQRIFGASEYVKDGLAPIVEITGKDEWYRRMKGIEEAMWKQAQIETEHGRIPSEDVEVNGEQLQVLPRLFRMSGERKFLQWAERLAAYYLSGDRFVPQTLDDHGDEIIGGLGLFLGVLSEENPQKAKKYRAAIRYMLDEIIERGTNKDGLFYNSLGGSGSLSDNWGYNYVAHLCYDMVLGESVYRSRIKQTLRHLGKPKYADYPWEGGNHPDGYGDSIEGGIYMVNHLPVEQGLEWVDREAMKSLVPPAPNTLGDNDSWGVMKLHANGVRTVLMHALMHTRGCLALPWQQGLQLGASERGDSVAVVVKARHGWSGQLLFDIPRHREYMQLERNWPRINTMPEWFTVEPDQNYTVRNLTEDSKSTLSGQELHNGKRVELAPGEELQLIVTPQR